MTHTTEDWHQELRRSWRCRELRRPWRSWELRRPWQVVFGALASVPSARPPQPEPFLPPKKISLGYQEPSGAKQTGQYITWQEKALQGQTNRTGHPTGTRSPPGLAWKLRLPLGMTRSQGPSQGPSATTSTSATARQAAGMASAATTRGAACPDESPWTRQDKVFLNVPVGTTRQTRHSWPWRVDWIHGARVSGGRRAWVSGDPAGLSQRRAGGVISRERRARWAADGGIISRERRARWAADGGVIWGSRGRRVGFPRGWRRDLPWTAGLGSSNPGSREPAGGLGIATAGGGYLPRSAGMRARGQWAHLPWETKHRNK